MAVSGLIVTLTEDAELAAAALRAISRDARFTLNEAVVDRRVAVVLDTPDPTADRAANDWLRALRGVEFVDVVLVYLDDAARTQQEAS